MSVLCVSIVGRKGSGKAEIIVRLVRLLSAKGFRVGVIKRLMKDDLEIDEAGTDTYRYRLGGAERVMLASRRRLALFCNLNQEIPLAKLLAFFESFDLVLIEGFVSGEIHQIEACSETPERLAAFIEDKFLAKKAAVE